MMRAAGSADPTVGVPPTRGVAIPASARKPIDGENFPVALRVLPTDLRRALLALYEFARYVDDLGDEFDGSRVPALHYVSDQVRSLYRDGRADLRVVSGLSEIRLRYAVPAEPFLRLVRANIVDQRRNRYRSSADLLAYCELSANPVGRVVLRILGVNNARLDALSDRICTGLQIIEHIQDVREDYLAGRIYLPQEHLARFHVPEVALGASHASASLRALIRYETEWAVSFLDSGARLLGALRGWGRLAVAGFLAGGRAAAASIRAADYDIVSRHCAPAKWRVAAELGKAILVIPK